jgi:hypothetical protein
LLDNQGQDQKVERDPGFAPHDIGDGRARFEWGSRWPPEAKKHIRLEAVILGTILVASVVAVGWTLATYPNDGSPLSALLLSWLTALLGGTSFGIKWLYHSVAKGIWHLDRRLWRFFSPAISSILAVFVVVIVHGSEFTRQAETAPDLPALLKISLTAFLAGYFSDNAYAKLAEVAQAVFGTSDKNGATSNRKDAGRDSDR